eukprot:COSAG06_NODE_13372_length_1264_cov_0.921030_1_plen_70_part_00
MYVRSVVRSFGSLALRLLLHSDPVDLPVVTHRSRGSQSTATAGASAGNRVGAGLTDGALPTAWYVARHL